MAELEDVHIEETTKEVRRHTLKNHVKKKEKKRMMDFHNSKSGVSHYCEKK